MSALLDGAPQARIRDMQADDLDAVAFNEAAAYAFPWSRGIFEDCLSFGHGCWVLDCEPHGLIGHAVMSLSVGEGHILNLSVHPHFQGLGLGGQLLSHLVEQARGEGANCLFLEVRVSNTPARRLYARAGFEEVGWRRGYYPDNDGREDAVVLRLDF